MTGVLPKCRSCGAPILWAKTAAGKPIPLNPDPVNTGNIVIRMGPQEGGWVAHYETKAAREERMRDRPAESAYTSHFSNCPQAKGWRNKV